MIDTTNWKAVAAGYCDEIQVLRRERDEARAELRALKIAVLDAVIAVCEKGDTLPLASAIALCGVSADALLMPGGDMVAVHAARAKLEEP